MITTAPARADDLTIKDSVDYTLDDGIMSPDEMEDEANYVHEVCSSNPFQDLYFNCDCVAGAFLIQREKDGPMVPQSDILEKIMHSKSSCANPVAIAGNAYETCMKNAAVYRELKTDNPEYCTCVANKVAKDFSKSPMLDIGYIENINIKSITFCSDPGNRPAKKTANAATPKTAN